MFGLGLIVGVALFAASMLWYRAANGRLSTLVLGYDGGSPNVDLRRALGDLPRFGRAWTTPSADPVIERERVLTTRRGRIMAGMVLVSAAQPLVFELLGTVAPVFARGGPIGVAIFVGGLAIGAQHVAVATRNVVAYRSGREVRGRALVRSILGVTTVVLVSAAVLIFQSG